MKESLLKKDKDVKDNIHLIESWNKIDNKCIKAISQKFNNEVANNTFKY